MTYILYIKKMMIIIICNNLNTFTFYRKMEVVPTGWINILDLNLYTFDKFDSGQQRGL